MRIQGGEYVDQRQSTLIKAMRFPLIVLVVFAHSLTLPESPVSGSGFGAYYFVTEMISHNLAKIAVPWFFIFSGYFFFFNLPETGISASWVTGKWNKRLRSLLLPYVLWNLIAVLAIILKSWVFTRLGFEEDPQMEWVREWNVPGWLLGSQPNFPLWYMRDLMILSLFAPVMFYLLKNVKLGAVVVIALYLLPAYPDIPGERAICFFTIGSYIGLQKWNLLSIVRKAKTASYILAPTLLLLATVGNNWTYHGWLLKAFYPFGMIALMNLSDKAIDNEKYCKMLVNLSASVFFIYAAHEIFILGWSKGLCLRIFGEGVTGYWVSYFIVPIIVLSVCYVLYRLFNRFTPRVLAFCCGGRVKK